MILEKLGVINYFDVIVNPVEVKKGKPAPDIFLLAQEQLKLKKEECVGIEDAVVGVEALNKANIKSIAITNGNNNLFQKATLLVQDTSKLIWDLIKPILF